MKCQLKLLRILFPYVYPHKKEAIMASFLIIIASLLALPIPYLMKFIIDNVLANKNLRLLNMIILLLIGLEDFSRAEEDCKEAIKINPKFDMPYFIYGLINFKKEELLKAKDKIVESLRLNNQNADAHYYLGQIYIKIKEYNLAKELLKKALLLFNSQEEKLLEKIEKKKSRIKKAEKLQKELEEIILKIKNCEALPSQT